MQSIKNIYEKIYDFENLHKAWEEARKGKRYRDTVLLSENGYIKVFLQGRPRYFIKDFSTQD